MNVWILVLMISGQILTLDFYDKESCDFAGYAIRKQYNINAHLCLYKGDKK